MSLASECVFVGIDVGKAAFLACAGDGPVRRFANDAGGIAACLDWLAELGGCPLVGFEATGGHEYRLWEALVAAGIAARQLNPARIRAFARAGGTLAKTDPVDARLIAGYLARFPAAGRALGPENQRLVRMLCVKRRQIVKLRKTVTCQSGQSRDPEIAGMEAAQIALFEAQIAALEARLAQVLAADAALAEKDRLLRSIPGIGPVLSRTLIGEMPELGRLSEEAVGALAGLAPVARDSGAKQGRRFIQGGRKPVRDTAYVAAIVAARYNPDMKRFADAKKREGKPPKQIICAIARKLLVTANAVLKRGTPWENRPA